MSLSRPTASRITRKLSCAAVVSLGLLGVSATSALARKPVLKEAVSTVAEVAAVCPGQTFSQPFEALNDSNYYTLVEGSEFNAVNEGWELKNGAQVVQGTRPDGSSGGVLDMPSGSVRNQPAGIA